MSTKSLMGLFLRPSVDDTPRAFALVRSAIGFVFVTSGALKLLFENQGPGRFAKLGLPPDVAYAIGVIEIICGAMVLFGCFARLAALPLVGDMIVAIVITKLPLLTGPGPEPVAAAPKMGLCAFAYQARLDLTMLLACATVAAIGAGGWSIDAWLAKRRVEAKLVDAARAEPRLA